MAGGGSAGRDGAGGGIISRRVSMCCGNACVYTSGTSIAIPIATVCMQNEIAMVAGLLVLSRAVESSKLSSNIAHLRLAFVGRQFMPWFSMGPLPYGRGSDGHLI